MKRNLLRFIGFALALTIFIISTECKNQKKEVANVEDSTVVMSKMQINENVSMTACCKTTIEWVSIPAGTFMMGSPTSEVGRVDFGNREYEEIQHQVKLDAFRMSKYEVTVGQFKVFIDSTGFITDAEKGPDGINYIGSIIHTSENWHSVRGVNWRFDEKGTLRPKSEYDNPVIHVSWNDAKAFAEWMRCRLPTEAEWEYACRAGSTTPFNTGENLMTSQANFNGNYPYNNYAKGEYREKPLPVGSFSPNAWGLYDMHGNVSEWCNDWKEDYPTGIQTNPKGPVTGSSRIIRGGSWFTGVLPCRSASRFEYPPMDRHNYVGIRLVYPSK